MAKKAIIGASLQIDGEKEFRKAVADITKDQTVLNSEMKKTSAAFDDNAYSMEALTAKSAVYNKQIDAQKSKIDTLKAALANASTEYGETDSRTKEWTIKLNNAEAGLSKLNSELKSNENNLTVMQGGLDKNGAAITNTTGETSKYHDILTKVSDMTGIKIPAGLETFAVGAAGAAAAVVIAFKAVEAMVVKVQSIIETASANMNELSAAAQKAQLEIQQYAALEYAADIIDINVEALTTGYAKIIKLISDVNDGNKTAIATFQELGISVRDMTTGELRDANDIFTDIVTALGNIENDTLRNATATDIFGKSAKDLFGIFEDGGVALAKSMDAAWDKGIAKSQAYYDNLSAIADETDSINAQLDVLKNNAAIAWKEITSSVEGFFNMENWNEFLRAFVPDWLNKIAIGMGVDVGYDPYGEAFGPPKPDDGGTGNGEGDEEEKPSRQNILDINESLNSFAAQNNADLAKVGESLTTAQQQAADNMSEAVRKAQIDADDSSSEAYQKIMAQLKEIEQVERITAEATASAKEQQVRDAYMRENGEGYMIIKETGQRIDVIDSYASGTNYVPRTGKYELHEGEKVIPKAQNNGSTGNVYNITIDAKNVQEFNDIVRIANGAKQSQRMGVA